MAKKKCKHWLSLVKLRCNQEKRIRYSRNNASTIRLTELACRISYSGRYLFNFYNLNIIAFNLVVDRASYIKEFKIKGSSLPRCNVHTAYPRGSRRYKIAILIICSSLYLDFFKCYIRFVFYNTRNMKVVCRTVIVWFEFYFYLR